MHEQQNPVVYLAKRLWRYSKGNRRTVVLYVVLFVVANSISFLEPLVIARLLNTIQELGVTAQSVRTILLNLGALLVINISFWLLHGPARVLEQTNAFLVRANYKKFLLDGVMAFPIEWHSDHHSGDTIDKIEKGTGALYHFSEEGFQVIDAIVLLTSSYIALTYFNLHSGYIVLFMVIGTISLIMQFDKVLVRQYKAIYGAENRTSAHAFDVISNITTVIILRIERLVATALFQRIMEPFKLHRTNVRLNETKWFLVSLCSTLMVVLVLGSYFAEHLAAGTTILIGTVYALYGYVRRIEDLFYRFAYMYSDIVQRKTAVMNAEEIANEFSHRSIAASDRLQTGWRELQIEGLSFSYQNTPGGAAHLDNLSLTIRRGQRVALIGASGSGKTTLLKIIRELYRPQSVTVRLDNAELPGGFAAISAEIALIPQDPEIFNTTIRENITVGVKHVATYIKRFTDIARFTDVIERLPHKLDSLIFEKGVNLSGGEKQRLALARGLMACDDKAIVLLDEPTSSVDTRNELRIYENIFKAFPDKTIVSSIHRLHLLNLFDQIVLFRQGKIAAAGTLDELLHSSKEFRESWDKYHRVSRSRSTQRASAPKSTPHP